MKKRLKINGIIIAMVILFFALFPGMFLRKNGLGFFEELLEICGVGLILLGQLFRVSARGYKAEHSKEGSALIQGGPYSLIRNPMYLGILLIGLGVVSILLNLWATGIFLAAFVIQYILLIFKEEKKLLVLFPDAYRDYCKKIPHRILPSLYIMAEKDITECLPLKLSWLKKEIASISVVLFLALFIETWEDIKTEGLSVYLKEARWMLVVIILFICLVYYLNKRTINLEKDDSDKSKSN
jgi:protein-S-isoprenylcysteine O-methyltransferase Ste14